MSIVEQAEQLAALTPSWEDVLKENGIDEAGVDVASIKSLSSGSDKLFPFSLMWVDQVGDSSANIEAAWNVASVFEQKISHACNMTSTTCVFKLIDPSKPGFILVSGSNGEYDTEYTLYVC